MIGTNTIFTIDINIGTNWISIEDVAPAYNTTNKGVKIGANNVDTVVADTDNGTLPFARNVITLDAVPPGQAPNKIKPIPISGGKLNNIATKKPAKGIHKNWITDTRITFIGCLNTSRNTCAVKVKPIANMTNCNMYAM